MCCGVTRPDMKRATENNNIAAGGFSFGAAAAAKKNAEAPRAGPIA